MASIAIQMCSLQTVIRNNNERDINTKPKILFTGTVPIIFIPAHQCQGKKHCRFRKKFFWSKLKGSSSSGMISNIRETIWKIHNANLLKKLYKQIKSTVEIIRHKTSSELIIYIFALSIQYKMSHKPSE